MIRSMTGYGKAECRKYNRKFSVEIKSVNHRYNDITIKMPRIMNSFEENLRSLLSAHISRGKTDVYVNYESFSGDDVLISMNTALSDAYFEKLNEMKSRYDLGLDDDSIFSALSKFPDVFSVEKNVENENTLTEMWETLREAAALAIAKFVEMREREGEALRLDLLKKNGIIKGLVGKVGLRSPFVAAEYRVRLKARLAEALGDVELDEARLLTEITVFADKCCIDEELTRLDSHLSQIPLILEENDSVGRKLDFLVQEMNREANTIGSKSNDIEITKIIIDMKSEIEKIREQVQNIE